ncbi:hypothetical protein MKEN_01121400 [Mycena kentingensis (nom. inval.)]|nr:hypothetical protein MKEN_01121400 [Mycena kentingensis (nom. inval.)]
MDDGTLESIRAPSPADAALLEPITTRETSPHEPPPSSSASSALEGAKLEAVDSEEERGDIVVHWHSTPNSPDGTANARSLERDTVFKHLREPGSIAEWEVVVVMAPRSRVLAAARKYIDGAGTDVGGASGRQLELEAYGANSGCAESLHLE